MLTHEEHIKKILELVMFDNDRNYYLNQLMVDNIGLFKRKLDRALNYYYLPLCAEQIIIYEKVYCNNKQNTTSSSSTESDSDQQVGRGFKKL